MELEFEYEEKQNYTNEDVQAILSDFKSKAIEIVESKDLELAGLTTELEKVEELEQGNHLLQIKNLAISNGIDEDLFDLIVDDDIEVVKAKIDKLKAVTKEKEIDNSFKPTENRAEDAYTKAESNNDVKGMLSQKINRIFN